MQHLIQIYQWFKSYELVTNRPQPAEMMLSKPSSPPPRYTCQWLDSVDMYLYVKLDQN